MAHEAASEAARDGASALTAGPVESRWLVVAAVLAVGGLYAALPDQHSLGPPWLLLIVVFAMVVPGVLAHRRGYEGINRAIGHITEGVMTLFMLTSLGLLIRSVFQHSLGPLPMFRSAVALWLTNILVFALWYWRLDAGGPYARQRTSCHTVGAFLFPQMTLKGPLAHERDGRPWAPQFVDYLFLAFNTSTAFSPTDVPVLSRWAKPLVMIQSLISLTTVALVVGRFVNII